MAMDGLGFTRKYLSADGLVEVVRHCLRRGQGYHFEHNFGHGNENLCSVITMLMLLAFLFDQIQQLYCKHYQKRGNTLVHLSRNSYNDYY